MSLCDDLKAYLDGELSPTRSEEIRNALQSDPVLRRELQEIMSVTAALGQVTQPESVGLEATLLALHSAKHAPSWRTNPVLWTGGLAAVACAVLLVFVHPIVRSKASSADATSATASAPAVAMKEDRISMDRSDSTKAPALAGPQPVAPNVALSSGSSAKSDAEHPDTDSKPRAKASRGQQKWVAMRHEKSPLGRSFRTEMAKRANHSYAPNVSGSNLRDRVTSLPLTPSNPPEVETVVLAFESIDRGEQAVRGVLSRFKSQGAVAASDRLSDKEGHTFVVDVPEGEVSHTIDQLKRLPFREPVARDLADVGLSVGKPIDGGPTEASTAAGTIAGGIGGAGGGKSGRVDGQRGGGGGFAGGLGGGAAGAAPGGRSIGGGQFGAASAGPSNRFAREAAGGFSQKKLAGNAPRQDASDFKVQRRINSGTSVNATVSPVVNEKSSIHAGMQLKLNTAPVRPVLQGSTAKPVVMRRIVIVVTVKKK